MECTSDTPCLFVCFGLLFVFITVYVSVRQKTSSRCYDVGDAKLPIAMPSSIPYISNTLSLVLNPRKFMLQAGYHFQHYMPVHVQLLIGDLYVVRGIENMSSLWRESAHSASTELHGSFFGGVLGMPKNAAVLYSKDTSGFSSKPHPNSHVEAHNRIDHITHQVLKEFLQRPTSHQLHVRFAAKMKERFAALSVQHDWVEMPDLLDLFEIEMLKANLEVQYGTELFELHPGFVEDFWYFSHHMWGFARPFPRWTMAAAHAARQRILDTIKTWQRNIVQGNSRRAPVPGSEPYWSDEDIRKWYDRFMSMDGFDEDAVASLYLGIIWVSNYNFILAVYWMVREVFQDPTLLAEIRDSLRRAPDDSPGSAPEKFPLIQSAYAETLRLHTEAHITRRFPHKQIVLGGKWVIPANKTCFANTHPAHQDKTVWNTYGGEHPVDQFWAGRFLVFPNDKLSGPLNPGYKEHVRMSKDAKHEPAGQDSCYFSLDGLNASWIPFGGGPRACPGRHIAKQQILSTFVSVVEDFDIKVDSTDMAVDERNYGLGAQLPKGKTPFQIRRRPLCPQ